MHSLRNVIICTSHCLRLSNRLVTHNRLAWIGKASSYATLCASTTSSSTGTRHAYTSWSPLHGGEVKCTTNVRVQRLFCTASLKLSCWNCRQPVEETPAFFCLYCKVLQPPDEGATYFKIMDCDQTFALDPQRLQKRYLHLQRSLHPDNFSQKSAKEQEYSEYQSALVNKAYRTLLKPLSRGIYMLELKGVHLGEGTDPDADPRFLLELMEINEAVQEACTPQEVDSIGRSTKEKLKELTEQIDASLHKGELQAAKAFIHQMKYFANIEEKVKEKRSELM